MSYSKKLFKIIFFVSGIMGISQSFAGTGHGDINVQLHGKTVDEFIIEYMKRNNIPSLTLAIVQAPYITRVVGYGLADTKTKQLASMHTVYAIGQMTNAFTAIAILQLKEAGKLTLDDTIDTYIDTIPQQWNSITIRDLLTHSSGIPDYTHVKDFDYSNEYTYDDIISLVKNNNLLFKPGAAAHYSATNSYILGIIIEQTSGTSYQEFIQKNQIDRIGLKNTFFIANQKTIKNEINFGKAAQSPYKHTQFLHDAAFVNPIEVATGYDQTDNGITPAQKITWSSTFAASGMLASAQDISLWDISLAGDILVKDINDRNFLYNSVPLNGTLIPGNVGWFFPGHTGLMEIKGNLPGYSAFLSRFTAPAESLCVTLLVNKGNVPDLDILARKIAGAFDGNLAVPHGSAWAATMQSPYSVEKTIERISHFIKNHGGTVFAHINHAQEAEKVNLPLQPTQVLVVGNPAQGTAMMQANQNIALDLPLKIMATQDSSGQVWLSFTDPVKLAQQYGELDAKQRSHLQKIYTALLKACQHGISPY